MLAMVRLPTDVFVPRWSGELPSFAQLMCHPSNVTYILQALVNASMYMYSLKPKEAAKADEGKV
jgi:hypothetical protein